MNKLYPLEGRLQHYIWGGKDYLAELLKLNNKTEQHYAEYWLGAHPSAPSLLQINQQTISLDKLLSQQPELLGEQSLRQFGNELPYLLKILDVAKPLSIQLHPTKRQAEIGFELENQKGIPLTDPKRTYKDRNHKPEMMIALSDFWLLHGFKSKQKIVQTLSERPSLAPLIAKLGDKNLKDFYAEIMQADQSTLQHWLMPIIEQQQSAFQQNQLAMDNPDYWLLHSIQAMDIPLNKLDAGLVCFYLFNIVHLQTGEGIYQDAGIPHAYLRGQNIELMACSDNVIRGGLTPKHIDIEELLKVIDCQEIEPKIIPKASEHLPIIDYATPAKDFALTRISYQVNQEFSQQAKSASILLVMDGALKIQTGNEQHQLSQGQVLFIASDTSYHIQAVEQGYGVIAQLP